MYQSFFELSRSPFEMSPDPNFFYSTSQHREALAGLYYGIQAHKGFLVLTGEVGTGKTLIMRCLQDLLDKNHVNYAYVFNTQLSREQFLPYIAEDLGITPRASAESDLLMQLSRHLIQCYERGLTTVLVVDEAQHLSATVLEEIRLLTNLETPQGKLLQIVLVGQPELSTKLESSALRQLKQRVALWFRLRLLTEPETFEYVRFRLQMAGDQAGQIFSLPSLQRVYLYSQGIPRLVNTLCDNAMLSAFALAQNKVTPQLIDEAALDLGLKPVPGNGHRTVPSVTGNSLKVIGSEAEKVVECSDQKSSLVKNATISSTNLSSNEGVE